MGGIRACIAWLHPELQHHGSLYRKEVAHGGDAVGFEEDIQERLWSLLKVDSINLDEPISSELRHEIDRDGRVLYEAL